MALLLIPPAAARPLARTSDAMAIGAAIMGAISAPIRIGGAQIANAPASPRIVLAAAALFALSLVAMQIRSAIARQ